MQIVWEEKDIKVGRTYGRPGIREKWLIGYRPDQPSTHHYVSVSLSDGMVTGPKTSGEMANMLTDGKYFPSEYLDATHQQRQDGGEGK